MRDAEITKIYLDFGIIDKNELLGGCYVNCSPLETKKKFDHSLNGAFV